MMAKTITIHQLDTGYLILSEEGQHAITSNDVMIAKVRDIFGIQQRRQPQTTEENIDTTPTKAPENRPRFGILSELAGTWPINTCDYMVPDPVPLPNNQKVTYFETVDGRLLIKYRTTGVNTTFEEIQLLLDTSEEGSELKHIPSEMSSNYKTCIRQFMIAVRAGLKSGDSVDLDLDKDFRPVLNRTSVHEYERGTLKDV